MSAKLDGQLAKLQQVIEFEHARYVAAASVAVAGVLDTRGTRAMVRTDRHA